MRDQAEGLRDFVAQHGGGHTVDVSGDWDFSLSTDKPKDQADGLRAIMAEIQATPGGTTTELPFLGRDVTPDQADGLGPRIYVIPDTDSGPGFVDGKHWKPGDADGKIDLPRVGFASSPVRLGRGFAEIREKFGDEFDRAFPSPHAEDIDYRALYLRIKDEFAILSRGRNLGQNEPGKQAFGATQESHKALWALEKMEQAETFARVKSDMGASRG